MTNIDNKVNHAVEWKIKKESESAETAKLFQCLIGK